MLSVIPSVFAGVDDRDLERIKGITREVFPSVSQLGTGTLEEWLQQANPSLLLVDVRSPEEFAVSHLRGSVNLQTAAQIAAAVNERKPTKTVLYCSVGFRSSRLARALTRQGLRDVMNLEGSIFQWANEGRAVYQGEKAVHKVHPYGKRWAGLLKGGLASDE
jgi:rhodanese-related sulfurtransferase